MTGRVLACGCTAAPDVRVVDVAGRTWTVADTGDHAGWETLRWRLVCPDGRTVARHHDPAHLLGMVSDGSAREYADARPLTLDELLAAVGVSV